MSLTNFRQKSLLIFGGLLTAVLALELVLRLAGAAHLYIQHRNNRKARRDADSIRVLCVGESTTYMGKEHAYPKQLERILNEKGPVRKYTVLNKGQPGSNSQRILGDVEAWLDEYQPHIVVAMMGVNDDEQMTEFRPRGLAENTKAFLRNLRVFKLAKWLKLNVPAALKRFKPKPQANIPVALKTAKSAAAGLSFEEKCIQDLKKYPIRLQELYLAGVFAAAKQNYDFAEKAFESLALANLEPDLTLYFYKQLGPVLLAQEKYGKLSKIIMEKLAKNDRDYDASVWLPELIRRRVKELAGIIVFLEQQVEEQPESFYYYDYLVALHSAMGDTARADHFYQRVRAIRGRYYSPYTERNYQELLSILRQRGIRPVFVQYPLRDVQRLKRLLDETKGVTFVDNEPSFKSRLLSGRYEDYFTDRFAGDFGHCTPLGNELIARNVAQAILD